MTERERKTELIQARVSPDDKADIEARAAELRMSVSEYLRLLARMYELTLTKREP